MQYTKNQQNAIDGALRFLSSDRSKFLLSGLAGTGKTTTSTEIIRQIIEGGQKPLICAPTGKAAHVLNAKLDGIARATTIHKALTSRPMDALARINRRLDELEEKAARQEPLTQEEISEESELIKELDRQQRNGDNLSFIAADPYEIEDNYDVMIFDEASMIGLSEIYEPLILPIQLPCMFVGDSAQLPPVKDQPAIDFTSPDYHLSEILRQGKDSGILQYAHAVHKGRMMTRKEMTKYDDVTILNDSTSKMIKGYEDHQCIVWTNKERHRLCPIIREARGFDFKSQKFPDLPMVGETLIVDTNDDTKRILRGMQLTVTNIEAYLFTGNTVSHDVHKNNPYFASITFVDEQGRERTFRVSLTDMIPDQIMDDNITDLKNRRYADLTGIKMSWQYAITCHKAQGSEYEKVFIVGSMLPGANSDWKKWWYTAVTRARSQLVVASYHYAHEV